MNKIPKLIGITGGIGTGKSTVCRIFALLGVPIYDSDTRARWLMNHLPVLKQAIIAHFGQQAYQDDGTLNRVYMARQVFQDAEKVKLLNQLTHPRVGQDFLEWVSLHQDHPYLLNEAALLFESGRYKTLHQTIVVQAPEKLRIERVMQRDPHRSEADIRAIMQKQMPEEEKKAQADYIITNDESQMLIPQVLALHQLLSQVA
ncbi:MAG: dephospho-CoA kinase [Microscillaceae bacterium]